MRNSYKYKELIEFWLPVKNSDNAGGSTVSYNLDFSDYVQIVTKDEQRKVEDTQVILEGYYEVYLRFRNDKTITKNHFIKMKGKQLTIHSIVNVNEMDSEIKLICSESDNLISVYEGVNPYENY